MSAVGAFDNGIRDVGSSAENDGERCGVVAVNDAVSDISDCSCIDGDGAATGGDVLGGSTKGEGLITIGKVVGLND